MVWRKAAVSARKAEDHAERRRPVNQPRGLNRRESAPFDSARRWGLLLPKSYPLARNAVVEKEDPLDIPLILHRRIGFQQEIAYWAQIEIERLHVAAPLSRNATPSLPKPPMPFSKPPSPSTNQTECPLIPLYKGITGLPQQTEECCPRLPLCKGSWPPQRTEGLPPVPPPPFSLTFHLLLFPQSAKKSLSFYTTDFSWNPAMNYPPGPSPARYFRRGEA